jgi:hypothetical protein
VDDARSRVVTALELLDYAGSIPSWKPLKRRLRSHASNGARRQGVAEQLPEAERLSLRQYLRDSLDHATIKGRARDVLRDVGV